MTLKYLVLISVAFKNEIPSQPHGSVYYRISALLGIVPNCRKKLRKWVRHSYCRAWRLRLSLPRVLIRQVRRS